MSPPSKAPPQPELDRGKTEADPDGSARAGSREVAASLPPPQAAVITGQQTAGNRAVAALLGGRHGVQRAPKDDDPRRTSGMAHGPTLDSSGGVATAPTQPAAATAGPAPAPAQDEEALGPAGTPLKGPPTFAGSDEEGDFPEPPNAPRRGKHPEHIKPATAATQSEAEEAYRRDPRLVYRSRNDSLHRQYWTIDPATGGGPPRIYRSGSTYIIAPDLVGPGLPPPHAEQVEADEGAESAGVGALGEHLDQRRRSATSGSPGPSGAPTDGSRRALFPGSRRGPEPGMRPAEPVSHDDVMKAYRQNPSSVHASTDDEWHRQVYSIDRGQGQVPRAYRSGSTIIVDPSYPLDGRPPTASPAGSRAAPGPGADVGSVLNPVPIPTDPARKAEVLKDPVQGPRLREAINQRDDRAREEHMARARAGLKAKQEESKVERPIPKAMSTIAPAPINPELEGDIPRDQTVRHDDDSPDIEIDVPEEKKPAKWGIKGGNVTRERTTQSQTITRRSTETTSQTKTFSAGLEGGGYESKRREETRTDDQVTAKETTRKVTLGPQGFGLNVGRTSETAKGATAGADAGKKTTTAASAGMTVGPGGVGATGTASITSTTGAKAEATAGVKVSDRGMSAEATGGYTGANGAGMTVTVSGGIEVEASDPELVDGWYVVSYTKSTTSGAAVGGSYTRPGGGPTFGANVGSSSTSGQTGKRRFKDEQQAKLFKENAALELDREEQTAKKMTTAEGALDIPIGEERGSTDSTTDTMGASGGMSGASVTVGKSETSTHGLRISRVSETKVRVTPDVSETKGSDAGISAWGVFGNTKGGSTTDKFAVTYEFDLGSEAGRKAFEAYCATRLPPPPTAARLVSTDEGHSGEEHDTYRFKGVGTVAYQDTSWNRRVVDETGTHEQAGGSQSHKVDLNWVRNLTGDDNVHSETQIVANLENGKDAGYTGQMTVGGESGAYNREQFGKIFMGARAKPGTKVTNSGEWTLSADISPDVVRELERVSPAFRNAKTKSEKLKVYGELAKAGGAAMLGGQVRRGGSALAWNLELKGDPNFPGAAGRARLEQLRTQLAEQLKSKPDSADAVAREAKETLDELAKRLADVSDEKKYTDLPDELRKEQVDLINHHVSQFQSLRSQALSLSMRGGQNESIDDVRARAANAHGYDDVRPDQREVVKLRHSVQIKEADIATISREVQGTHRILGRMMSEKGVRLYEGVKREVSAEHSGKAKAALAQARAMDERLKASAKKARELRDQWSAGGDPQAWLAALRALDAELAEQKTIVKLELEALQDAVREAYIITTDEAIGRDWAYFQSIKADAAARSIAISGFDEE